MPRSMQTARAGILWRGNPGDGPPAREENRLRPVFDACEAAGIATEPIVFAEEAADDVRQALATLDGVLVWVDPVVRGRDRSVLDALLREAAAGGLYVSAHPDVIPKMGTKDVLVKTRGLGWGSDTHLFSTFGELREQLPPLLRSGPRVLKRLRGSQGNGVWKVELTERQPAGPSVRLLPAGRGSSVEDLTLDEFLERFRGEFAAGGGIVDQPYAERLGEGMIRCYLVRDRVVGFGHQFVTALLPPPPGTVESPPPPPRYYFGPEKPEFQELKAKLETGWIAEMQRLCGVASEELPVVWDADFLLGPRTAPGQDTYVLCEINVMGVFPLPEQAFAPLAEAAKESLLAAKARRRG